MTIDWSKPIQLETGEPLRYIGSYQGADGVQLHVVASTPSGFKHAFLYSFYNDGSPTVSHRRAVNCELQKEQEPLELLTDAISQMAYKRVKAELLDKLNVIGALSPQDIFNVDYNFNIQVKVLLACLKRPDIITALFDE